MVRLALLLMLLFVWVAQPSPGFQGPLDVYCNEPKPGICNSVIVLPLGAKALRRLDYRLTSLAGGVQFDVDGNGSKEQTAWTAKDSHLAFLALDRNGNGAIDSGKELFGVNTTPSSPTYRKRGIEAFLDELGRGARPNVRSPLYKKLLLWEDANHNGISERTELHNFSNDYLEFENQWRADPLVYTFGNRFHYRGVALPRDKTFMDTPFVLVRSNLGHLGVPAYEIEFSLAARGEQ